VKAFLKGVIARQGKDLQIDPYAMAFNEDYTVNQPWFELDSLLNPIELDWTYWKVTGDSSVFTASLSKGFDAALATMLTEQHHNSRSHYTSPLTSHSPVGYAGMIWSAFRPSDGRVVYHYNIPGNMMAVVALRALAQIEGSVYHNAAKVAVINELGAQVNQGIQRYGIVHTRQFGDIYAYEVDGLGHHLLGDDANVPSLLSAPYLGYLSSTNPLYLNTRKFILSPADPDFFHGTIASGVGSQENTVGYVWPLSLMMQGMTSTSKVEKEKVLKELLRSDPGDHYLHESFDPNNAQNFTRPNFGWPNSLFVEYVYDMQGVKALPTP
jgi:meiotically up-regulated gene 157 (Mug157) protein